MNNNRLEHKILLQHIGVFLDYEKKEVEDKISNQINQYLVILHLCLIWEEKVKEVLKKLIYMFKWKFNTWIVFKDLTVDNLI